MARPGREPPWLGRPGNAQARGLAWARGCTRPLSGVTAQAEGTVVSNGDGVRSGTGERGTAGGAAKPTTAARGPFAGLGRLVVGHPWLTILAWVVVAVAVIATSPGLPTTSNESSFLPRGYESIRAANLQDKAFPAAGHVTAAAAIIVFSRADGGQLTAADSAKIRSVASSLNARHIHNIVAV